MIVLAREDFTDLPIGNVSKFPYSPAGEYHVEPDPPSGRWEEANISGRWRDGTGCWKVIPEDGRRVMEQTFLEQYETPSWFRLALLRMYYVVSADVRVLGWARPVGLVVRYQHSRQYYFFALCEDHVAFIKRDHDQETELARARGRAAWTATTGLTVGCCAEELTAAIDGTQVLTAQDDAFPRGRIGLLAETTARFADVQSVHRRDLRQGHPRRRAGLGDEGATLQEANRSRCSGSGSHLRLRHRSQPPLRRPERRRPHGDRRAAGDHARAGETRSP
jgi:hypothetical protein